MGKFEDEGNSKSVPLNRQRSESLASQISTDSGLSIASESFMKNYKGGNTMPMEEGDGDRYRDIEDGGEPGSDEPLISSGKKAGSSSRLRQIVWLLVMLCVGGWVLAFVLFLTQKRPDTDTVTLSSASTASNTSAVEIHEPHSTTSGVSHGKPVTLEQVLRGTWSPKSHAISWIAGPDGEDGLLVEQGEKEDAFLRVKDIRSSKNGVDDLETRVLMEKPYIWFDGEAMIPVKTWPSPDLNKVLIMTDTQSNWRHSYFGKYWILDVATQKAEPLDPGNLSGRVQLAVWSPTSDAVVFVRENNLFLRKLASLEVTPITKDGNENLFYGVPDWVYEEEVFAGNTGTWWSGDGKFVAFLRTNESAVPDYPVQYFLSRPSGKEPPPGLENYPEVRQIKYPKPGSPNPIVNLQFYDVEKNEVFSFEMPEDFVDDERIIIEIVWASGGNVLVRETNRESDVVKIFVMDTKARTGKLVRSDDIAALDGGWVEPSQSTRVIPADPQNGRPHDGYIDTVIYEGYDHLAYFTPFDNPVPVMLTKGNWEVVKAPSAVDLKKGLVYFVATKEAPTQRHVYSVKLDGSDLRPLTNISAPGFFEVSFSHGAGYGLLSYKGPAVPWQAVINTQGDGIDFINLVEENVELAKMVEHFALPIEVYTNVTIDGYTLQVLERRPPNFDPAKKYPVLFFLYGGPGSQTVDRKFTIDFQTYIASSLGYIVVTVDGRGTGFIGREARCVVRGNIGHYEALDQIETAKIWASKSYVDESRMAVWGWSYGGYMTLKVLEQDAGETFQYGMAVAPVTDWMFYDSIYTERYMHTPEHNPSGYANASISDVMALGRSVRFLIMHGVADDNVHLQNTLVLIDKLDLKNIDNYDMQVFPDSDHSIQFHMAHALVYERLSSWLINAFNGEWQRIASPKPQS
ncbi:Pheromone maturation dipeptidyl aminopeptidase DapB [Penicillium digitatum]|uniref:dipeptidyl-peptidase IV n=3 Tax=Penicillium digitatum TaxID=36651 RepID=K9F5E4_PEND2|nr:Pheromone maturation dipeptidyl aminopeptidase DapB [Penicillium digitatum Pd1]EKV04244.1 Pheromone maturation dipeptidyl aminopeptidase DapB [Penicillium digitatum PHI26]EKV21394.1 Pheromone maturation dipeptidyl aminopeptidase DapB [Penicillium digitatum Pd1]QQK47966.1 Pheromone maturation dipeptidyl aminopeptidase DapB [Penicillium digitatum]